ncbi:hypothetical protein [Nitrincola sp. A-D6]|uniref:hypothetical protein n=1 Tax=Nitrincola sp. A-D6 TaxID=1545442 RepID=UPI001F2D12BD|nr:hypothetical protein [Nitrincola sp. A-D6]
MLSEHEPDANRMPVARTLTGNIPLSQLEQDLEDIEIELESAEAEREALTRWIYQLQRCVAATQDSAFLSEVADQTLDCGEIFALQGWVAETQLQELQAFAESQGLVLLIEDADPNEIPPHCWKIPSS